MEPSGLSLVGLLERLGLPDELVLCVYQYGSRVCGTATATSDWDLTIVVDDTFEPTAPDMCQGRTVAVENIDANVHHKGHFMKLVRQHDMRALTCIWLPPQHVWRETVRFADDFTLDLETLRTPVSTISSKAFGYATICFREGRNKKALKNLIHSIRYLLYGIQIAERGRIHDFTDGNEYYHNVMKEAARIEEMVAEGEGNEEERDQQQQEWEALRIEYRRIAKEVHERFDRLLPPKIKVPRAPRRKRRGHPPHQPNQQESFTAKEGHLESL